MFHSKEAGEMTDKPKRVLSGVRVLDLTEDRGLYAGKLLADLGAEVIKVEKPGGSKARQVGPFKDDIPSLESSLYNFYGFADGQQRLYRAFIKEQCFSFLHT